MPALVAAVRTALSSSTLRAGSFVTALRAGAAGIALATNVVVARSMGAAANGELLLAIAVTSIGGMLAAAGMSDPVMRVVAVQLRRGLVKETASVVRSVVRLTLLLSIVVAAGGVAWVLTVMDQSSDYLVLAFLAVPAAAATRTVGRAITGAGRPVAGELVTRTGQQALLFALLVISILVGPRGIGPVAMLLASFLIVWAVSELLWKRAVQSVPFTDPTERDAASVKSLVVQGLPLLFVGSMALLPQWLDVIMIAGILDTASAGVYGVWVRAAALISLVLVGGSAVGGPMLARLHASGDLVQLRRVMGRLNRWTILVAIGCFLAVLCVRGLLTNVLGPGFEDGSSVLIIASLGQVLHVSFGMVSLLLAMSGHSRLLLLSSGAALLANVACNLILIPRIGIDGAAWAGVISVVIGNSIASWFAWRNFGVKPFNLRVK